MHFTAIGSNFAYFNSSFNRVVGMYVFILRNRTCFNVFSFRVFIKCLGSSTRFFLHKNKEREYNRHIFTKKKLLVMTHNITFLNIPFSVLCL
ncbi:hypothetical protein JHK82_015460 [Glycine max]|uniref:Uncharacterized protein n=2 Tax=Glycine subgen. Soja TaxID=1462606 RepID=A0A0R0JMZ9_SOYBN|nr:hypothetical protein JHK87_015390 [Glycine soja]KAG5031863.1 hypothetical protein JHK85_015845 [Glycine max]KAG5148579.1 hypothetical protein JHK82_015460 [Glycine max]KAH1126219.1 hypothetical protein GYH30_015307 [Glycine max]KRH54089.1 hypothetical protein GLYMA_06G164100v4 [Glycine max]